MTVHRHTDDCYGEIDGRLICPPLTTLDLLGRSHPTVDSPTYRALSGMEERWTRPPVDPDPLRPRGTDDIIPSAEYVQGFDDGYSDAEALCDPPFLTQFTAFGLGIVIGMAIAAALVVSAVGSR